MMEVEMLIVVQQAMVGLLAFLMLAFIFRKSWFGVLIRNPEAVSAPPEVPGKWPLIGHLHKLMGTHRPLARIFGDLAEMHGPLITIWIGVHRTVLVSSSELAKECFTTNDKALASRPLMAAGKYLGYDYAVIGFSPYKPFWREMRKIATQELLSTRQLELLKHVRATEVDLSIKRLYLRWMENKKVIPIKVEMTEWFGDLTFNNVMMNVVGKRYFGTDVDEDHLGEAKKFLQAIRDTFSQSLNPTPSDAIPVLERFDIGGRIRAMKKTFQELDSFCSAWLKEHRLRRLSGKHERDQDFLDVMLTIMDKSQFQDYDADTVIKATCLTMILGGADTTSVTLTWVLSLLLNNHGALRKARDELDAQVGKDRKVTESDIENLPYLRAIVKETMRLYPAAPLGVPHEAMEDCCVGGHKIPAGTWLMVNFWKIQRDPRIWSEPLKFWPERFLSSTDPEIDVRGQHFELLPFGSGRRMCPGINFALHLLHLTLARLLHGFDVETPFDEPVDLSAAPGTTMPKATPLEVLLTPRLSVDLYL